VRAALAAVDAVVEAPPSFAVTELAVRTAVEAVAHMHRQAAESRLRGAAVKGEGDGGDMTICLGSVWAGREIGSDEKNGVSGSDVEYVDDENTSSMLRRRNRSLSVDSDDRMESENVLRYLLCEPSLLSFDDRDVPYLPESQLFEATGFAVRLVECLKAAPVHTRLFSLLVHLLAYVAYSRALRWNAGSCVTVGPVSTTERQWQFLRSAGVETWLMLMANIYTSVSSPVRSHWSCATLPLSSFHSSSSSLSFISTCRSDRTALNNILPHTYTYMDAEILQLTLTIFAFYFHMPLPAELHFLIPVLKHTLKMHYNFRYNSYGLHLPSLIVSSMTGFRGSKKNVTPWSTVPTNTSTSSLFTRCFSATHTSPSFLIPSL
jgi:hypothetical protein